MKTAFKRDAVLNDKFYFRKDVVTGINPCLHFHMLVMVLCNFFGVFFALFCFVFVSLPLCMVSWISAKSLEGRYL